MVTLVGIAAFILLAFLAYLAWGTGTAGSRIFNRARLRHTSSGPDVHEETRTSGLD